MSGFGSGFGVLAGLADSEFLSDVDAHDRDTARLAMTLAGGVTLGFGAATLVGFALGGLPHTLQDLLFDTAANGMLWLTFVALAALIAHHRLRAYLTAATHIRWRLLALGLGLSLLALMPVVVANILTAPANRSLAGAWASIAPNGLLIAVLSTALLIPAAAAEELFFRGWLLRQTAAFTRRPVILIVLTALIFSAIHRDFNPDTFLSRMLMGAGFAYMTLRLGGIEFSAGAHAANNIVVVLFMGPLTLDAPAGGPVFSAGTLITDAAIVAGYVLMTEAVARVPQLQHWARVQDREISPVRVQTPSFS